MQRGDYRAIAACAGRVIDLLQLYSRLQPITYEAELRAIAETDGLDADAVVQAARDIVWISRDRP